MMFVALRACLPASPPARRRAPACRRCSTAREVADHEDVAGARGCVRSGSTSTRPARSSGTPSDCAERRRRTPAAHSTVRAAMRSSPTVTPVRVDGGHQRARPHLDAERARAGASPRRDSSSGYAAARAAPPSSRITRDLRRIDAAEVARAASGARSRRARRRARRRSGRRRRPRTSASRAALRHPARARPPRTRAGRGAGSRARPRCVLRPGASCAHSALPK